MAAHSEKALAPTSWVPGIAVTEPPSRLSVSRRPRTLATQASQHNANVLYAQTRRLDGVQLHNCVGLTYHLNSYTPSGVQVVQRFLFQTEADLRPPPIRLCEAMLPRSDTTPR